MKHKHHLIPKHRGGSDDPSNLVEVTPTQHAMFHYCEWMLWGNVKDFCAYKMILGDVKNPEFRRARNEAFKDIILEGGRKWRENNPDKVKESGVKGNKSQREKLKKYNREIAQQKWEVITPNGDTIIIENIAKFCLENNLQKSKMTLVSQGERKQHKGYKCRKITGNVKEYEGDFSLFEWEVTTPNNEVFAIENLKTFCIENNLKEGMMYRVGRGERKHHKGYRVKKVVKQVKNYLERLEVVIVS